MASEVPISDDDYAMAATWAVEHVAALGILGRNVLTDLFSICDKNAHLPARVEQRLVWVLLNDVVEGDGEVSAHVCKMMDKLSPLTAQTSQEVADICVRIRQAVCVRSIDEPAHFAAMVDELFPTNTGNALLDVASRDMLKVLDAVEGGNDGGKIEEAKEMYGVDDRQLRLDLRRFATIHGQKMGGSSVQRLVDDIAAARYDPPGPNRNHASLPRGVREILDPGAALTASPLNASPSPRRKSMLRTASGAPKGVQGGAVDLGSDSDDDEPSSSKGVGGRATSVVPQSAIAPKAKGGGFCGECGASYDRAGQKFCMECGAKA